MLQPHPLLAPAPQGMLCVPKALTLEAGGLYLGDLLRLFDDQVRVLVIVSDDTLTPPPEAEGDVLHAALRLGTEIMTVQLLARPTVSGLQWTTQAAPVQTAFELDLVGWLVPMGAA